MRDRRDNEHPGWVAGEKGGISFILIFLEELVIIVFGSGDWQSLFMFNLYV